MPLKFSAGERIVRVDGSDQPDMVKGNTYTVAEFLLGRALDLRLVETGDRLWNSAAFGRSGEIAPNGEKPA